ncbi:MAG: FCD domain-containing protein, partial [Zavarzinia sp.]|nr:FCD domain-containing protein [Zavarzinia sp.]
SGNQRLARAIESLLDEMARLFHLGLSVRNRTAEMQKEHHLLVQALVAGDAERAESLATDEILGAQKMVMDAIFSRAELLDLNITDLSPSRLHRPQSRPSPAIVGFRAGS